MKWTVKYSKQADKFLAKSPIDGLDSSIKKAIQRVILRESTNIDVQKMKGAWRGFYRIRQGDLRIILKFEVNAKVVLIYKIGWRGDVYK